MFTKHSQASSTFLLFSDRRPHTAHYSYGPFQAPGGFEALAAIFLRAIGALIERFDLLQRMRKEGIFGAIITERESNGIVHLRGHSLVMPD
jgi:hypothetical protein